MRKAPQEERLYHLTVVTTGRRRIFRDEAVALLMLDTIKNYRDQRKFALYAFVVMPDHVHLLLTPAYDVPLEKVAQLVKGGFSFNWKNKPKGKNDFWERGFDDRRIKDLLAFEACRQYIVSNPVRSRMTSTPEEYPYSSLRWPAMIDPTPEWLYRQAQG